MTRKKSRKNRTRSPSSKTRNINRQRKQPSPSAAVDGNAAPSVRPASELKANGSSPVTGVISFSLFLMALLFWGLSLPFIDPAALTDYGIVAILPWTFWIGLAMLTAGFCLTLMRSTPLGHLSLLHLAGLVLYLHALPAIVYGTLRYSWAWKHLGIVDFIQRHGAVDPVAQFLPAYHNWPGLFYATAVIANLFELDSLELANYVRFTPTVLTACFVLALTQIYRRFTDDARIVYAASWIFVTGNWIGQDYFSPQGVTFLFYLIIIGICVGPLRHVPVTDQPNPPWWRRHWLALVAFAANPAGTQPRPISGWRGAAFAATVLVLIMCIVATHQLTPIVLILSLAGLALIGQLRISYCLFAICAEVLWLLYFAAPFVMEHLAEELGAFGGGIEAASQRLVQTDVVSYGRIWVVIAGRVLTVAIAVTALLGGVRRYLMGYRDGAAAVLAGAALPLFVNPYGGEILFRVYMFALPFLAFFSAAMFFPSPQHGRRWGWYALFGIGAFLAAIGFLLSNNGKDRQYVFTADEVETATWLYANAPPNTLLIEGSRGYPSQFLNYENFHYVSIALEEPSVRKDITENPESILGRWLENPQWSAGYVIITASQKAYSDAEGIMPPGALDGIEAKLLASPRFVVVKASAHARIFALHPDLKSMRDWTETDPAPGR